MFDHPNVLSLEAVCTDIMTDPLIILDCPAFGDLKALLRHTLKGVVCKEIDLPDGPEQSLVSSDNKLLPSFHSNVDLLLSLYFSWDSALIF